MARRGSRSVHHPSVASSLVDRARALSRFDPAPDHRVPAALGVLAATVASVGLSLLADAGLVAIGTAVFPATESYPHFRFGDYAPLTVIGVLVACVGWPVVVRCTSAPRWVFCRLAVLVSAALLLPDLGIWVEGQPGRAVVVLMAMHVAIGLVTYNVLVRIAPVRPGRDFSGRVAPSP
jgi:hypothetical protein